MIMARKQRKRTLTAAEEFEIMKLVLDKFLWLGFGIMAFGLYNILSLADATNGLYYILSGAVVLLVFMVLIVKEYEFIRY